MLPDGPTARKGRWDSSAAVVGGCRGRACLYVKLESVNFARGITYLFGLIWILFGFFFLIFIYFLIFISLKDLDNGLFLWKGVVVDMYDVIEHKNEVHAIS